MFHLHTLDQDYWPQPKIQVEDYDSVLADCNAKKASRLQHINSLYWDVANCFPAERRSNDFLAVCEPALAKFHIKFHEKENFRKMMAAMEEMMERMAGREAEKDGVLPPLKVDRNADFFISHMENQQEMNFRIFWLKKNVKPRKKTWADYNFVYTREWRKIEWPPKKGFRKWIDRHITKPFQKFCDKHKKKAKK